MKRLIHSGTPLCPAGRRATARPAMSMARVKEITMTCSAFRPRNPSPTWTMVIALLAILALPWPDSAYAQTLQEKIKNHQPVVVGTEDDYRPFEYVDNGKPVGLDNELFQLMKADAK